MRWIRSFVVWDELQSSCIFATLVKRRKKGTEHSLLAGFVRGFQRNHGKNEAKQIDLRQGFMDVYQIKYVFTNWSTNWLDSRLEDSFQKLFDI